jgi:SAM-dependent methyltransferase
MEEELAMRIDPGSGSEVVRSGGAPAAAALAEHWDAAHATRAEDDVSWFQAHPATSLQLVFAQLDALGIARVDARVLDAGAGRSRLVDLLLDEGVGHVTLVDISAQALEVVRARIGARADVASTAGRATTVVADVADVAAWSPPAATVDVWHDRAVLHFLVDEDDRRAYVAAVTRALAPHGRVVLATFAPDGPTSCSGLAVRRSDATELAALFGSGFTLVHTEREEHVTPKDVVQPFTWVVLARR